MTIAAAALALGWATAAWADDWGEIAQVSATMGVHGGRICIGEFSRGDLGCPDDAPTVSGHTVSGTFVGDGSGLTGVVANNGDRIVSGTTSFIAVSDTSYISLTQAGVNTGWLSPYTGLVTLGVSSTGGISGSTGYFRGRVGIGTNAPSFTLTVSGTGTVAAGFYRAGGYSAIQLLNDSGNVNLVGAGNDLVVQNGGIERIRLTSAGNLGIGTAAPSHTLHVQGTARIGSGTVNSSASPLLISNPGGQNTFLSLWQEGVASMGLGSKAGDTNIYFTNTYSYAFGTASTSIVLTRFGAAGVATAAPSTTLHVSGTIRIADGGETCDANRAGAMRYSSASTFDFCDGASGWRSLAATASAGGVTTDRVVSGTNMVIAGAAGVSITYGVSTSARFFTNGSSVFGREVPHGGYWGAPGSDIVSRFMKADNAYIQAYSAGNNGNAGIEFHGAGQRGRVYGTNGYDIYISPNDQYGATKIIMVNQTGANALRVGISTTTPSVTLTVNGDAAVSGTVQVAGTGAETCAPGLRGTIRQNPVTRKLEICRF